MIPLLLSAALAGPCEAVGDGFFTGPVTAALRDGALGQPRRACLRTEFGAGIAGRATIDTANFYGYLPGGLVIDGSGQVASDVEVFGRLEAVRVDMAVRSLTSLNLGLGHLSAGAAWGRTFGDDVALSVSGSLVLPTAYPLYRHNPPLGFDVGVHLQGQPHKFVGVYGSAMFLGDVGVGSGPALPNFGANVNAGIDVRPATAFGFAVGLDAGFGMRAPLDHLSPSVALRFGDGRRFGFELGARLPIVGAHRELAAIGLRAAGRFGSITPRR